MRAAADGAARREVELLELLALKDEQLRQHSENLRAMGKRARPHSLTAKCLPLLERGGFQKRRPGPLEAIHPRKHMRARTVTDTQTDREACAAKSREQSTASHSVSHSTHPCNHAPSG
jgi:hypothetical protein